MSKRLSEFYGLDMYSFRGEYVGKVEDVILNLDKGMIMSLCLKPLKGEMSTDPVEIKRILTEESVSYDNVIAVGDIVLVKSKPTKEPIRKFRKGGEG